MRDEGLGSWPRRRAEMAPGRVALIEADRSWTYAEVHERTARLAHGLRTRGIRRGDRVAYLGPNAHTFVETFFAVAALGAVFVPLNTRLAPPEIAFILADAGVHTLVFAEQLAPVARAAATDAGVTDCLRVGAADGDEPAYEQLVAAAPENATTHPEEAVHLHDLCMVMYTSGTTGRPKGAMITHGNLTWNTYNVLIDVDVHQDEVTLVNAPLFHAAAFGQAMLPTFIKGATSVIVAAFDADEAFDLIARHGVTFLLGVPAMFLAMRRSRRWDDADLSTVRMVEAGGAPVPQQLIRDYQDRGLTFLQGYGMTEAAPGVLFLRTGESLQHVGAAGTPCFFTDVTVVDPTGSAVPEGGIGEILVRGPNVMRGYYGRPDVTDAVFTGEWFHSGDVAQSREGALHIVDRIKDVIISGGENIYPAEVEAALDRHPAISQCAVIGVPDDRWGEVGYALLLLEDGAQADADEILASLEGQIARYKIPKRARLVDELPRNAAGKLLRAELRERYAST